MGTPIKFTGTVKQFPGKSGWIYIAVPSELLPPIMPVQDFGYVPIMATVGQTTWDSFLLPIKDQEKFIALKAEIRKKEKINLGDTITIEFKIK